MLACPSCRTRLTRTLTSKGVVYACGRCGGRAVGVSVLRKQAEPDFMKKLRLAAYGSRQRLGRRCPHCAQPMAEVQPNPLESPLTLDVCTRCHFVWFDAKEFAEVPQGSGDLVQIREPLSPRAAEAAAEAAMRTEEARAGRVRESYLVGPDTPWKYIPAVLGMPVELQADALGRKPVMTWAISAVTALVFLALLASGGLEEAIRQWGFIPAEWARHSGLTLLTGFFLHAGLLHVASNLYFLLIFGDNVEDHLGRGRFLLLLVGAHLAGAALHAGLDPRVNIPCVGASAGIAGVIAYYGIAFPHARIGCFFWFHWFAMPAFAAMLVFLALQLVGAWAQVGGFASVSYLAHLGGLGVGIVAGLLSRSRSANAPP